MGFVAYEKMDFFLHVLFDAYMALISIISSGNGCFVKVNVRSVRILGDVWARSFVVWGYDYAMTF